MKMFVLTIFLALGAMTVTATAAQLCCTGGACCDGGPCCD
jgi:hypothetical protein